MRPRPAATLLAVVILAALSMLPASQSVASPAPGVTADKPVPAPPGDSGPGEYGSSTYYSSDREEAQLRAVAKRAKAVGAVGSARLSKNDMVIMLPSTTAVLPPTETIGAFVVTFKISQFTTKSLRATEAAIVSAARVDGRSSFGFFYDASIDRIRVGGKFFDGMLKSLDLLTGLQVEIGQGARRAGGIESRL